MELNREGENGKNSGDTMPIDSRDSIQDKVKKSGTPTKFVEVSSHSVARVARLSKSQPIAPDEDEVTIGKP